MKWVALACALVNIFVRTTWTSYWGLTLDATFIFANGMWVAYAWEKR